jgi:hypothetical protein
MIKVSEEQMKNPAFKAAHDTCIKLLHVIREDSKTVDHDILEYHAAEYYGTICSTMMNTILINMVKGMDIPDKEQRDNYYMNLVSELGKHAIQAYLIQLYSH